MSETNERIIEIVNKIKDELLYIDHLDLRYDISVLVCQIEDIINEKPKRNHHKA